MIENMKIKIKNEETEIKFYKTNNGREYIELNKILELFFDEISNLTNSIPSAYLKTIDSVKFIDKLALCTISQSENNYEFFKFVTELNCSSLGKYDMYLYCDSSKSMLDRVGVVPGVEKQVKTYNRLQNDLLHKLENERLNREDKIKLVDDLEELRISRRKCKNELAYAGLVQKYGKCIPSRTELGNLQNEIGYLDQTFNNKVYIQRITEDNIDSTGADTVAQKIALDYLSSKNIKNQQNNILYANKTPKQKKID